MCDYFGSEHPGNKQAVSTYTYKLVLHSKYCEQLGNTYECSGISMVY